MTQNLKALERAIEHSLSGKGSHVEAGAALEGLDWEAAGARPGGAPHSIFQLLNHVSFWQDWAVKWLDGQSPPVPKHAGDSWPGDAIPKSRAEWDAAVARLVDGTTELVRRTHGADLYLKREKKTRMEMHVTIASHSSYHMGQVVLLRQMLGSWPPPSGGVTW